MPQSKVDSIARRIMSNVFLEADPSTVENILTRFKAKQLSEHDALSELAEIEKGITGHLIHLDPQNIQDEWRDIAVAAEESERRYLRKATQQFYIGTFSLPVSLLIFTLSFLFGWQNTEGATVTAGLLVAGLAALAAHSFLVLRVHQQASTAAERLAEKRLALLFLKVAVGSAGEERKALLDAGTSMFLGHQAPETIPLSSDDLKMLKDASK